MADEAILDGNTQQVDVQPTEDASTEVNGQGSETPATGEATKGKSEYIPRERFDQVYSKAKDYEAKVKQYEERLAQLEQKSPKTPENPQEAAVKENLKKVLNEMGFVSREELEVERKREEQDRRIAEERKSLEAEWDGKDGKPKYDHEAVVDYALENRIGSLSAAFKLMNEETLTNYKIQQALVKSRGVTSERSDGSGATSVGVTDEDLKARVKQGDQDAVKLSLKRLTQSVFNK